jgi:hypothetical protein
MHDPTCSCYVIDGVGLLNSCRRGIVIKVKKFNIFNLFSFVFWISSRYRVISVELAVRAMGSIPIDDTEDMRQNIPAPAHLYKLRSLFSSSSSFLLICFILSPPAHDRLDSNLFRLHSPPSNDLPTSVYGPTFFRYEVKVLGVCYQGIFPFPFYARSFIYKYVFRGFCVIHSAVSEFNYIQSIIWEI